MKFVPTVDFWSDEMKSQYCKGLSYTVRAGNDRLAAEVAKWRAEGKVVVAHSDLPEAALAGKGQVS